jgi:hypothetical protein
MKKVKISPPSLFIFLLFFFYQYTVYQEIYKYLSSLTLVPVIGAQTHINTKQNKQYDRLKWKKNY